MYKENFKEWLELTWCLISEPWIKLFNLCFDKFAPRCLVYYLLQSKIKKLEYIYTKQYFINIVQKILKEKRITQKQAEKLTELIKSKPEYKMEVYRPDPNKIFVK